MTPGGGSVRRAARAAALVSIALSVLVALAAPAGAASDVGEDGSGPSPLPIVAPHLRAGQTIRFSDVGADDAWARAAIQHVAGAHTWMRDFAANEDGTYPFRPGLVLTRKYFARALVKAFVPDQLPDGSMRFADLDPSSPWFRWAAVAVDNGWLAAPDGRFGPDEPVTMGGVHRAIVWALGLRAAAGDLNAIHTSAGQTFRVPANFGSLVLGMRLGLRYNAPSGSEGMDVGPTDVLSRAQVAFSLYRATTLPAWAVGDLREQYDTITLPYLGARKHALVQWGIRYAGYPYIWGGEWGLASPEPAALGGQPRAGFDCSGITWWIHRENDGGAWKVTPPRPYAGWALPQRTSADMARATSNRLRFRQLAPGDLMFYDGNDDGTVDHVDTYIGNGFALDSSSTPGGVTIMWVGDGWYRDHFVYGRRVIPG